VVDAPFDRKEGDEPALNDAEIADVIAFLKNTDGRDSPPHGRQSKPDVASRAVP
jgi:cytochrome c peroxidase